MSDTTTTQTHPNADYTIVLSDGSRIDALPTPMLLDRAGRQTVEAYEQQPATDRYPAIWRMRDDDYDAPGTVYRRVSHIERKGW